jgi:hypothetical protein
MEKFKVEIDSKHTVWYRTTLMVEATSLEEAKRQAKVIFEEETEWDQEEFFGGPIEETLEYLTRDQNEGAATRELFVGGEFVTDNLVDEDTSDYDDDPAFDHLRDEERNFIDQERENEKRED